MNNSDNNDFTNWQNGDENEMNNPNNNPGNFFFYGPMNPKFREMWNKIQNGEDINDSLRDYLNMDDIINDWSKQNNKPPRQPKNNHRPQRQNNKKTNTMLSQDEYMKLIEIRGYLNITEQYAHVKALDRLLNQIIMLPKDNQQ